jgi:hypothetical protein
MFELALPDQPDSSTIVADLAAAVLTYVGYAPDAIAELTAAMRGAVVDGGRPCRVTFQAHEGHLQIAVACDGAAQWHTNRPLP